MEEETSNRQQRDKDKVPVVNAAAAVQHHGQCCKNAPKVKTGCTKEGLKYLDNKVSTEIKSFDTRKWEEMLIWDSPCCSCCLSAAAATSRCTRWWLSSSYVRCVRARVCACRVFCVSVSAKHQVNKLLFSSSFLLFFLFFFFGGGILRQCRRCPSPDIFWIIALW